MFNLSEKIEDAINDDVLSILNVLNSRNGWDTEAKMHLAELQALLKRKRYKSFNGHPSRYHLTRIGQSCLYDVPLYRKGFLAAFRGKRIRLVCMSSGRYSRLLMAGVVGITPPDKLRRREEIIYVFPERGDHEIAYLGRRYMLIQTTGKFRMPLWQGSFETIDPDSCDFILLDGKECGPIATLTIDAEGKLNGRLLESASCGNRYESIPKAIRGLAKENEQYRSAIFR